MKFFTVQADGSTDSGNIEDAYTKDGKVHVRNKFLTVRHSTRSNAEGLYECFTRALTYAGIPDWQNKLVEFGSDGASVNVGARGLKHYRKQFLGCWSFCWFIYSQ